MIISRVLKSKLFSNIFNQFLLYGFSHILPFLLMPYLLATIGVAKYGLVNFAIAFAFYFQVFQEWGFDLSNVRHVVKYKNDQKQLSLTFFSILSCKFCLAVASFIVYLTIVYSVPEFRNNDSLYLLAFVRLLGILISPYWLFRSMEDVKYVTRVSLIVKCISILPIFVVVRKPEDFTWVMFFFALETVLSGILALGIAINKYKLLWVRVSFNDVVYYFKDSFSFFTSMFLTRVYQTSNTFILGVVCGDFVTGIYSAAEKLHNVYTSLITPLIEDIFYPYFSRIKDIVKINMMVLAIIALNLFIIIIIFFISPYIIPLFIKTEQDEIMFAFNLFLLLLVVRVPNDILGFPYLGVLGKIKEVRNSTVVATTIYSLGIVLFLISGIVSISNIIYLLLATNLVSLLCRIKHIFKHFKRKKYFSFLVF